MYQVIILIIVLVAIYLFAIMPRIIRHPEITPFLYHFYAHRGFHDNEGESVENSLSSFKKATELDYGIELDVQLTKDNVLVVFHDETLKRICNQEGKLADYTYDELQQFRLLHTDETIPTFREVLEVVDGKIPMIIEVKMHTSSTKVCEILMQELEGYEGVYCMESFHPLAVAWFRTHHNGILRGQLSTMLNKETDKKSLSYFAVSHLLTNVLTRPDFIAYDHSYKNSISRLICKDVFSNLSVAWTIKSQEDLDRSRKDFDLFIFEGFRPK